ncbi:MAG: beta-propeller fold lactonase family protein [Acidobacteria bacterium]|nr:beta-propeller fold lactonase family protein [Acidobacteriota bacterium]
MFRQLTLALLVSPCLMAQVLYVPNQTEGTISTFIYDQQTAALYELPRKDAGGAPVSVAIHPSRKFALIVSGGNPSNTPNLASYSIDPATAALTLASRSPLVPGSGPSAVTIDPSGNFAFVAHGAVNNGSSTFASFTIDATTGALTPVPGSPFSAPASLSSTLAHPNGKFVYAAAATAGQIAAYSIGAGGALTAIEGSPFPARANVAWMAMDSAGKFLFAAVRQESGILAYSVNATTGALTPVAGSPFLFPNSALNNLVVDSTGNLLYATDGFGTIQTFAISTTGVLTRRINLPAPLGVNSAILDPAGKFFFATSNQSSLLATWSIAPTSGALTSVGRPVPTGAGVGRGAAVVFDPPVIAPIELTAVTNRFSNSPYGATNSGIARGSYIAITGKNIGPANRAQPPSGITIEIRSGDTVTRAIPVSAEANLVTAVVPSNTPAGEATLTLTYNGRSANPVPLTIVEISPGIRSNTETGYGTAIAWNVPPGIPLSPPSEALIQVFNTMSNPARPGQHMVVMATGLGPVDADETKPLLLELNVEAEVIVGHKAAKVLAKVRGQEGADFILFQLPQDVPTGCYVPIAVRAGGALSNIPGISISADGAPCSDPTGLSSSDIESAERTGSLSVGVIQLNRLEFNGEADSEIGVRFARYNKSDLYASFSAATADIGVRSGLAVPPQGTCTVTPVSTAKEGLDISPDPAPFQRFNPGPSLAFSGPSGNLQLTPPDYYQNSPRPFVPGDYTVDSGTWKAALTLPPPIQWTNRAALNAINRNEDLTVTWTGGTAGKEFVMIVGLAQGNGITAAFACLEAVSAGKFTVPSWILSNLPASTDIVDGNDTFPGGILGVITIPATSAGRFTAPNTGFATFTYEQGAFNIAPYR